MSKSRKILTSLLFASVMILSVSTGVSAEEIDTDHIAGGSDTAVELAASIANDENGTLLAVDDTDTTLTEIGYSNEGTEPRSTSGRENYIGNKEEIKTSGGTNGYITISSGVYSLTLNPVGSIIQNFYGVSAVVADSKDITTNISIDAVFYNEKTSYSLSDSSNTNDITVQKLNDDFFMCHAEITTNSVAFGRSFQSFNRKLDAF